MGAPAVPHTVTRRALLGSALVVPTIALGSTVRAQQATPAGTADRGVVYGEVDGKQLLVDVYRPADASIPRPAVVLFYPGGFMFGERGWMAEYAIGLAAAGYVAFAPDYRMLGTDGSNPWPAQLDDAQRAVRWVRANAATYGVDPERVASMGHSAGATLALQLGVRDTRDNTDPELAGYSSRVQVVVDIAGETDSTIPYLYPEDATNHALLLGGTATEVPEAYADYSVITFVDADTAPCMVLHSAIDEMVSVEHSRTLVDALHRAEVEVVYGELAGIPHKEWNWALAGTWTLAFLERQLRMDKPGEGGTPVS